MAERDGLGTREEHGRGRGRRRGERRAVPRGRDAGFLRDVLVRLFSLFSILSILCSRSFCRSRTKKDGIGTKDERMLTHTHKLSRRLLSLGFEALLFGLTLLAFTRNVMRHLGRRSFLFLFVRDGTWAFAIIFGASLPALRREC